MPSVAEFVASAADAGPSAQKSSAAAAAVADTVTPGKDGAAFGHEGKLVIVTGGANGIGRSVCLEFARCGANVLCADYDDGAGAQTVAEAAGLSGSVKFMHADMTDAAVPAQIVKAALKWQKGAPVGCLVNNVGIQEDNGTPVHLLDEAVWDKVMGVNIKSYFLMAKSLLHSTVLFLLRLIVQPLRNEAHSSSGQVRTAQHDQGAVRSHHQHRVRPGAPEPSRDPCICLV